MSKVTEKHLIIECTNNNRKAQKHLYERYAAKMFGACRRYIKNEADIEEVLLSGFFKVFKNIASFNHQGSFEGWIRRIIINECLMFLRKKKQVSTIQTTEIQPAMGLTASSYTTADEKLAEQDILCLLDKLPEGYRNIFNLYVIDGYKHKEIAEMLGISINTSKSQLIKARKKLQELLSKLLDIRHEI